VIQRVLSLICLGEVVSGACRLGIPATGRRVGVHCRYCCLDWPAVVVVHELTSIVVVDGLAGLQAKLEVSQPLLVLLPRDMNASLLAGVELGIADPAVVLQGWGTHHIPPWCRLSGGIQEGAALTHGDEAGGVRGHLARVILRGLSGEGGHLLVEVVCRGWHHLVVVNLAASFSSLSMHHHTDQNWRLSGKITNPLLPGIHLSL